MNKSNPSEHVKYNIDHASNWSVLANAPKEHASTKSPRGVLHCSGKISS